MPASSLRLVADRLSQRYGDLSVLGDLSFTCEGGEAIVVTGTNGSGKSTLLRTLAGLTPPASGTVTLDGGAADVPISEQCHLISALNAVKLELTCRENLAQWSGLLGPEGPEAVADALERLGLDRFAEMPAEVLSTGWRRRLALARLLVAERPLWLLDEPTAALDGAATRAVEAIIRDHLEAGGLAVVATHLPLDLGRARRIDISLDGAS